MYAKPVYLHPFLSDVHAYEDFQHVGLYRRDEENTS